MLRIPFALQWSIPENRLKISKQNQRPLFSSMISNIEGVKYYLKLYPNGKKGDNFEEAWIFLHLKLGKTKLINVDYMVKIASANYSVNCNHLFKKSTGWGIFICSTKEFFDRKSKFIVDGKVTIKVEGMFEIKSRSSFSAVEGGDDFSTVDGDHEQKWNGGELGNKLWENNDGKDFVIVVDGKKMDVHKLILGAQSDVFAAMFASRMKESIENKVEITDFSFDVVETAIKLIYDCNFGTSLSTADTISLLYFFDKYNIPALKEKVEAKLADKISAETVCGLSNCSILTNSFKLKEKCIEFLMKCFSNKIPLIDFDTLDKDIALTALKNSLCHFVETE